MGNLFEIRKPVSSRTRLVLAFLSWGVIVAAWFARTHWEVLPVFSLPVPPGVIPAFVLLWPDTTLLVNCSKGWCLSGQASAGLPLSVFLLGKFMAIFPC